MSWNVLVTARPIKSMGANAVQRLQEAGATLITPSAQAPLPEAELLAALPNMDAVLADMDKFTEAVLSSPAARQLKVISRWGVGYDAVDIPAATRNGIIVAYCPGMLNETVADYAFSLLCALARRVHEGHEVMRQGEWRLSWGHNIHGKTLGIVGCGRIGQAVARRAAGFNMRLLAYNRTPDPEAMKLGVQFVSLDELLAQSDFVSIHAALSSESRGLIGRPQLRRMKPSAYLINTARGALVDELALVEAVTQGWIAGAALDAYVVEPLPKEHPLRAAPNVLITPHQASCSQETGQQVSDAAADAIIQVMNGRRPRWVVDETILTSPALRAQVK